MISLAMSSENLPSQLYNQVRLEPAYSATEASKSLNIGLAAIGVLLTILTANNKEADQAVQVRRLIYIFVACISINKFSHDSSHLSPIVNESQ